MDNRSIRTAGRKRGVSLTGYGLLIGLIAIVALSVIQTSGESIRDLFGSASDALAGANGGAGAAVAAGPADPGQVPDAFSFTTVENAVPITQYTSNIVQITGLTEPAPVTLDTTLSAEFRICPGAGCQGNPGPPWGTSGTISDGQYVQVRATTDNGCDAWTVNVDVAQTRGAWTMLPNPDCIGIVNSLTDANFTNGRGLAIDGSTGLAVALGFVSDSVNRFGPLSNPAGASFNGFVASSADLNTVFDAALDGNTAFIAVRGRNSIAAINVPSSTSVNPSLISRLEDNTRYSTTNAIAVDGQYAYLGASGYFNIIDVSDPANMVHVSHIQSTDLADTHDLVKSGNTVFVAARGSNQLVAIDVSDVNNPTIISTNSTAAASTGVGGVDVENGRVVWVNVASPRSVCKSTDLAGLTGASCVTDESLLGGESVDVVGNIAYVAAIGNARLTMVDLSTSPPQIVASFTHPNLSGGRGQVIYHDGHAYVTTNNSNAVSILDVP